jgi:PAS domain S-box-containing protein
VRHRDGSYRVIESVSRNRFDDPVVAGIVVNSRDVTERVRAEEALRERQQFLTILNEVIQAALETPDFSTMLQILADRLAALFDADNCYITLWDEAAQAPIPAAACGAWREKYHSVRAEPHEPTMTESVLRAGRPLAVKDVYDTPYLSRRIAEMFPDRSLLGLPLIADGRKLGAVLVAFDGPHSFTDKEIARGEQVAGPVALAVAKARALEEAQTRWQEAETLRQAGAALTASLSLDETLDRILTQLEGVVPYDSAAVQLLRPGHSEIVAGRGHPHLEAVLGLRFPVPGDNPNTTVVESGRPVILTNAPDEHAPFRDAPHGHIRSWMGVPLIVRDRVIGMFTVDSVEPGHFTADHVRLVLPFGNQAAVAIENARLHEEAQAQLQLAQTLQQVGALLTAEMSLEEVFERLFDLLARVVPYDTVSVFVPDQEGGVRLAAWHGFSEIESVQRFVDGLAWQTLEERWDQEQVSVMADTHSDPRWIVSPGVSHIRSWVGAALVVQGRLIGELNVDSTRVGAYDERTAQTVAAFANQAAVAIENARLHEEVRTYAEELEWRVETRTVELRAEQEKIEAILSSVGEAIAMTDMEMRIQYINQAFTTLTGYTAEEALGNRASELLGGHMAENGRRAARRARAEGQPWQVELTIRRKDGRTYEAAMSTAPMRNAEGNLMGYVSSHRDISHLKELDRARKRFMTNVSHEMRTPVANMKLYAQLARSGDRPEKLERYLYVLEEQSERLHQLVDDILLMTEFDSGRTITTWEAISLPTLIDDVVTRYRKKAQEAHLTLVSEPIPPDLPSVKGDQVRLSQALGELVENAVTLTPEGGRVTIQVGAAEWDNHPWVTVIVQDTGPGIPADEREKVFHRFYRGRLVESGHVPGTGLGLSIVDEIVRAHGWRVTLESREGQGAAFTLWLRGET